LIATRVPDARENAFAIDVISDLRLPEMLIPPI
jgi:hypothetical protein